jgi:superfamily II DNA or RNA helicase
LEAPDSLVGQRLDCPACGLETRVPEAGADRSRRSWFQWLVHGTTPEQRAARHRAHQLSTALASVARELADARRQSEQAVASAVAALREQAFERSVRQLPVACLKDLARSARLGALESAGFRFVSQLRGKSSRELLQIRGIGPASANQIASAVSAVCARLQQEPLEIPRPREITPRHEALLRATFRRVRARGVSRTLLNDLIAGSRTVEEAVRGTRHAGALWRRVLARERAEQAIDHSFQELERVVGAESTHALLADARSMLESLRPPSGFPALAEDYELRFAEYFAVLDPFLEVAASTAEPRRAPTQRGRHGGVPAEIADDVEAVVLSLDGLDVDLRGYQEFGTKYLVRRERTVLGDEMGLGKTIQALAAMVHLGNTEGASHFLVVCPASIIGNWIREIEHRTSIPVRVLHGPGREAQTRLWQQGGGVAITSYATLRSLFGMSRRPIHLLVSDEAHYIKNPQAQRSISVHRLASHAERVVLMTGTALENHAREFVNLVRVCDQHVGDRLHANINDSIARPGDPKRFERGVAPVYLRRNQEDVLRELPECIEVDEWVTLTAAELQAYFDAVEAGNVMGMRQATIGDSAGSSKCRRLAELVEHYRDEGEKVVIFSFFLRALDLVGRVVGEHFRIDGSVSSSRRMTLIDGFNNTRGFAAMVCQIAAGGVGVNLQSASGVVILEPQFKPTTEWQAIKRVHRMGQSRRVVAHRLLARDTVDESLQTLVAKKARLFDEYARESAVKDASPAATDGEHALSRRLLEMEQARPRRVMA